MKVVTTRFAPSPTGLLHVGNIRTAIVNFLYAKKYSGQFILRIDDTDCKRSQDLYYQAILEDLKWLGIYWDKSFLQSSRITHYKKSVLHLKNAGLLYPCYETPLELEKKRKELLSKGLPPIYDRSALNIQDSELSYYQSLGRKPYYRLQLSHEEIRWVDLIKGEIVFHGKNLSDPVVIREDGGLTYMMSSVIDDIDYKVNTIIRGEDHVSNTALQIHIFKLLSANIPTFGHLSLLRSDKGKISKRLGGNDLNHLRKLAIQPMSIVNFFSMIGTSKDVSPYLDFESLLSNFDISSYSNSAIQYSEQDLLSLDRKLFRNYSVLKINSLLRKKNLDINLTDDFWLKIKNNVNNIDEVIQWYTIVYNFDYQSSFAVSIEDGRYLQQAVEILPLIVDTDTWDIWTKKLSIFNTNKKGKSLYMPLRLALTGLSQGPCLRDLLPLLSRVEIIKRLERHYL